MLGIAFCVHCVKGLLCQIPVSRQMLACAKSVKQAHLSKRCRSNYDRKAGLLHCPACKISNNGAPAHDRSNLIKTCGTKDAYPTTAGLWRARAEDHGSNIIERHEPLKNSACRAICIGPRWPQCPQKSVPLALRLSLSAMQRGPGK